MQLVLIGAFCFTKLLSSKPVAKALHIDHLDRRNRRNSIVYIGQILFSSVALPAGCVTLGIIFPDDGHYDAVDPNQHGFMIGLATMQVILYLAELFYRVSVRLSLVAHYILTSGAMLTLFVFENRMYKILPIKYGLILQLLAYTEQPLYITMLLRNVGFKKRFPLHFDRVCKIAIAVFVMSRVAVVALFLAVLQQNFTGDATAWRLREESFADWWNYQGSPVSPIMVNLVMSFFLVGILCANVSAVRALLHMRLHMRRVSDSTGP